MSTSKGYSRNTNKILLSYRYYDGYNDDPAYTSHSHGWSSGPTPALTFYVLGLTVTSPQGKTWSIAPHVGGGLPGTQGSFETSLGTFSVQWTLEGEQFKLDIDTPKGTTGVVTIPSGLNAKGYLIDGVLHSAQSQTISVEGGKHSFVVL